MNIAVVILWYLIGYVGCVWAFTRKWNVTRGDLCVFFFFAIMGPIAAIGAYFATSDFDKVVIRRRK